MPSAPLAPRLVRCDGAQDEARRCAAEDGHACPQAQPEVHLALAQTTVLTRKLVCPECLFVSSKGQAEVVVAEDGSASVSVCRSNQVHIALSSLAHGQSAPHDTCLGRKPASCPFKDSADFPHRVGCRPRASKF